MEKKEMIRMEVLDPSDNESETNISDSQEKSTYDVNDHSEQMEQPQVSCWISCNLLLFLSLQNYFFILDSNVYQTFLDFVLESEMIDTFFSGKKLLANGMESVI